MKNIFAESELICILKLTGDLQKETMDVNLKAENEAIKFLYACLEDIELERVTSMAQSMESSSRKLDLPLDHFNLEQRQEMLKRLVHRAESLREMTKKLVHHSPRPAPYTPRTLVHDEGKLSTRLMITHTPHALYPAL
jgi:hypothetical protein